MTLTLRFLSAVSALFAASALATVGALPAAAANPVRSLFHHSTAGDAKPQYVALTFRNTSPQQRAVQIGGDQYVLPAFAHIKLGVAVGSKVTVRSAVNRKVDGTALMTVTDTQEGQEILVN